LWGLLLDLDDLGSVDKVSDNTVEFSGVCVFEELGQDLFLGHWLSSHFKQLDNTSCNRS
jgi:hypothetical protein